VGKGLKESVRSRLQAVVRTLGRHLTERAKLDLLTFWGRNHGGWLSRGAIAPFTLLGRQEIDQALAELVRDGVIKHHEANGVCFYALTDDHAVRRAVLELGRLTPNERRYLVHRAQNAFGSDDREPQDREASKRGSGHVGTRPD